MKNIREFDKNKILKLSNHVKDNIIKKGVRVIVSVFWPKVREARGKL
jgi:hypothetical protein